MTTSNTTAQPCALQPGTICTSRAPQDQMSIIDRAMMTSPDVYGMGVVGLIGIFVLINRGRKIMRLSNEALDKTVKAHDAAARANDATIRAGLQVRS